MRALVHDRTAHAYLFTGPEGVGKEALALEFAKALLCHSPERRPCEQCSTCHRASRLTHPDLILIVPTPKNAAIEDERAVLESIVKNPYARKRPWNNPSISIDRIRELRRTSALKPLEGHRVVIIAEAEKMTNEGANSLLKILEEPPPKMNLILTTAKPNALLPTITSRCQEIRFGILSDATIEQALIEREKVSLESARLISRMSQGSYYTALQWLDEDLEERREFALEILRGCYSTDLLSRLQLVEETLEKYEKQDLKILFEILSLWFRDALMVSEGRGLGLKEKIVNLDKIDTLQKFVDAFEIIRFETALAELERATQMIERNIQLNLILIVLFTRLQSALKIKGKAA